MSFYIYWLNCETIDCPNKVCTWGSHTKCYPCEEKVVGKAEMINRYNMTHEHPYYSKYSPNYMTRSYAELVN